ncbi:MAG: DUF4139 domain-containing protein [Gemmataceae bacterium]|nr:DUF4139 domain-containing protein [Gemmataceae bacterium]
MKRRNLLVGLAGAAALAGSLALRPTAEAQGDRSGERAVPPKLPIRKVVLFSSGVGFFQREGEVDGDAKIDLAFPAGDINDLLKSLTVQDLGGGQVQAVGYDSRDPVERTLRSFAIDLAGNPSQAAILDQARGEKVEVVTGGPPVTGSILGVESKNVSDKDGKVTKVEYLNLFTTSGMQSLKLADVTQIRFLNPTLEGELRKALETLALSKDTRKKSVRVQFKGAGKRPVRVSYVTESPVWKTSYRLVLDKAGKPFLQGWAVVENPSDEDWSDVRMSLVSGRPISFKMDLYTPLYNPRPTVEPELFASLRPPTYEGSMERARGAIVAATPAPMPAPTSAGAPGGARGGAMRKLAEDASKAKDEKSMSLGMNTGGTVYFKDQTGDSDGMNIGQSVASAAQAAQLGDYFQYSMEDAVSVARQKSALIPIVNREVEGGRVSIFNPSTHSKYPLLGLRFKNAAGLSLMQGPVTVFDGTTYAGDARMPDLQAGEERLLSYAIDLGTEVEMKPTPAAGRLVMVKIVKGVMFATEKDRQEVAYKAVNRSKTDRTLLVEHPYRPQYTLTSATKPAERTRDMYRFEMKLPAGGSADLPVAEERELVNRIAITSLNDDQIRFYLQQPAVSEKVKTQLAEAIRMHGLVMQARAELNRVNAQLDEISKDQDRLRKNLKEMPPTATAYKRYLEKFDAQETQIEKLQADQKRLGDQVQQRQIAYEQFLTNLTVE